MKYRHFFINKGIISAVFALCISNVSYALSNDPLGKHFLQKAVGDLSNCGPISALMARQYSQKNYKVVNLASSIRDARGQSHQDSSDDMFFSESTQGRWWKMSDIKSYFNKHNVAYKPLLVSNNPREIVNALRNNQIVLINLNMNDIPRGTRSIGKPYFTFPVPGGWGHYLMIIGFDYIDGELVFEAHDSFRRAGKNRLFYAKNIMRAVKRYYPETLLVKKH
ncbi:MAG: Unknown protein [uncultured Thiotrichaceae bacterium]|uniref:Peptidase C39-like domain-containing protein n=1 Tax=uncultured Thiotrichaceae bacterium TaxID=298394 RepID=A0A6S6SEG1_9GAMM|nr:MAG: Unknown protein [uncultured Thiotrichaceae bacterium]